MTTETTMAPGPGGISPGRAACEAFWAAVGAGPDVQVPAAAWNWALSQNTTSAWEAAAKVAAGAAERDDVTRLLRVVSAVHALCRDTDGNWLEPSSSLPVGEFQAALALLDPEPSP